MTANLATRTKPHGALRLPYVDLLKVVMAIMVIGIHAPLFSDIIPGGSTLLNQGLYRIAVPTFFCLSAYFLSPSIASGGWQKWARRILLLYLIWMTLYLPFWGKAVITDDRPAYALFRTLVVGYWHLRYLIALFIGIVLLALLHKLGSRLLLAIAILLSVVGTGLEYGTEILGSPMQRNLELWRNALFLALPYLIIGLLLRRHDLAARIGPRRAAFALAVGLAILLVEILITRGVLGLRNPADLRLALLVAVPALTSLALALPTTATARALIPEKTGLFANGLYFLHIGVLQIVQRLLPDANTARTFVVIGLTCALTLLCLRIPLLRRLF